jgi:hypothetical protein
VENTIDFGFRTCPAITVTPSTLNGSVGASFSQSLGGAGGTAPYQFALVNGSTMPPGLSLASSGLITGTPTTRGVYPVQVRVTDAKGCAGTSIVTITVNALCIGNQVWVDMNNDGMRQPTESGVPNLLMQLWRAGPNGTVENGTGDDVLVNGSTFTDSNGLYLFDDLTPGSYYVRIPVPPPYFPSVSVNGVNLDNGVNNDSNALQPGGSGAAVHSPLITLATNSEPGPAVDGDHADCDSTVDFGFANLDPCYSGNLFDNPSFELSGAANVSGTGVQLLGFTSGVTFFGSGALRQQRIARELGGHVEGTPRTPLHAASGHQFVREHARGRRRPVEQCFARGL